MNIQTGKFSIERDGENIIINEWQGETKTFTVDELPIEEIADCLSWMSVEEMEDFKDMINADDFEAAFDYAVKMDLINTKLI